jgi:hypothetical protein
MLYFILADFGNSGATIVQPKVLINMFGHQNYILVHGLVKFIEVYYLV